MTLVGGAGSSDRTACATRSRSASAPWRSRPGHRWCVPAVS